MDIDPLTGEQKYPYRRFDDSGVPFSSNRALYQVDLSDPEQRGGLNDAMLRAAYRRGAIAPLWEVQTAKLQGDAGVPDAGLSEEERAAKHGLGAALDTAYAETTYAMYSIAAYAVFYWLLGLKSTQLQASNDDCWRRVAG